MYSYARSASILSKAGAELNMKPATPEEMDRRKSRVRLA
jgi:arginyl-tRNA synthetase